MTVSYTSEVSTCKGFGCFLKLLFRWKGSIYKLVWPDLLVFLSLYFALNAVYRFVLNAEQQRLFELICSYCEKYSNLIPVSFILGFYVSIVIGRWWSQYTTIPWPDNLAVYVSANITGQDEMGRLMRRTIMRYANLSLTICFTLICPRVKKRFPTLDHCVEAGLLLENEKLIMEDLSRSAQKLNSSNMWLPIVWAASIVTRARREKKITYDVAVKTIIDELNKFRGQCAVLTHYDWISVPLVYTQVVTLAVYSYFFSCIMGRQWLYRVHEGGTVNSKVEGDFDLVFPIFTTLQFFFYMGWLKVAESLINPFGDNDDDFELNWLVDRNLQVSYLIVDEMHNEHPELLKDEYWDAVFPPSLPHTVSSQQFSQAPPPHSTDNIIVSKLEAGISTARLNHIESTADMKRRGSRNESSGQLWFSARPSFHRGTSVRSNASQTTLAESVSGRLSRVGSVLSIFKRAVPKEVVHRTTSDDYMGDSHELKGSASNLGKRGVASVIPELDESNVTIMSMKPATKHPNVQDIFGHQDSDGKENEIVLLKERKLELGDSFDSNDGVQNYNH